MCSFGSIAGAFIVCVESIIPVCPPACGQARYGDAATLSTSTAALFLTLVYFTLR